MTDDTDTIQVDVQADTRPLAAALGDLKGLADDFSRAMTSAFRQSAFEGKRLQDVLRDLALGLSEKVLGAALAPVERELAGGFGAILGGLSNLAGAAGGAPSSPPGMAAGRLANPSGMIEGGVRGPSGVAKPPGIAQAGPPVPSAAAAPGFSSPALARPGAFARGGPVRAGGVMPFAESGVMAAPTYLSLRGGPGPMAETDAPPPARGAGGQSGARADQAGRNLHVTFNVSTPDAGSFRRGEAELTAMLARAVARGSRGL